MKNIILTSLVLVTSGALCAAGSKPAPKDPPAAQGYIKGQPSNYTQDKQLKELEREENAQSKPQPAPQPSAPAKKPDTSSGSGKATKQ